MKKWTHHAGSYADFTTLLESYYPYLTEFYHVEYEDEEHDRVRINCEQDF